MQRGFLREHGSIPVALYAVADLIAIIVGCVFAYLTHFGTASLPPSYRTALVLGLLLAFILFPRFRLYDSWRGRRHADQIRSLTLAWASVLLGLVFIAFTLKATGKFSRLWFGYWGVLGWMLLIGGRSSATLVLWRLRRRGHNSRRIAIIGSGSTALRIIERVRSATWSGLRVACVFGGAANALDRSTCGADIEYCPTIGGNLERELVRRNIDEVWICLPFREQDKIEHILSLLRQSTITQRLLPDLTGMKLVRYPVTDILGVPMLNVSVTPIQGVNRLLKESEDRVLAFIFVLLTSPLLILIALAVKFSSPGPIIYKQRRHGAGGQPMNVYKFRTMVVHREANGNVTQAKKNDRRITPVGAFLRRTSLDELPQLFNVLQGKMSIVGPRPHALAHNEFYKSQIATYMQRHKVKPGITGWAQVNGWRGETDTLEKMQKRVEYDMYYIENWSLWFDIKIIFLTLFKGFVNKNAY